MSSAAPPYPEVAAGAVGWLTAGQMLQVDRIMTEDLGIGLVQMMENAGRNLARLVLDAYRPAGVTVLAGGGGNGGGGAVAARHLANAGVAVTVSFGVEPSRLSPVTATQRSILERIGVPVLTEAPPAEVVIDALVGYSLQGAPRGGIAELVARVPDLAPVTVALDVPSGVDATTGETPGAAVRADATLTLALPKTGLRGHPLVGELYLADISIPPALYDRLGAGPAPDFAAGSILRVAGTSS